jgi:hypothetical protein
LIFLLNNTLSVSLNVKDWGMSFKRAGRERRWRCGNPARVAPLPYSIIRLAASSGSIINKWNRPCGKEEKGGW